MFGELGGAREPQQMRAVDVDDVQRDGDPGDATGLGDELLRDQVRRYIVQYPCDLECHRLLSAQLSGGLKGHRRDRGDRLGVGL